MSNYELTPGTYTNVKYWSVTNGKDGLRIKAGTFPWKGVLMIELAWFGLGYLMWWAFAGPDSSERLLRWGTVGFAMACALFCAIGPMVQMRRQRARGDILVYEPGTETLKLPREGLVLKRGQVIEFRILQEYISPEPGTIPLVPERLTQGSTGAAELQLVYQNPNQRICTLLRADGSFLFREVIGALKSARIAKVLLVEQQPSLKDWQAREA